MRGLRRHLTYANVTSTIALVIAVGGGAAYAANTIGSSDVIDESLLSHDIRNGEVKVADIGQGAVATDELANGQVKAPDIGDGEVRTADVLNDNLTGGDIAPNSLKGVDIDESTLSSIGGGGPAGGDLTGSYPNPLIATNAVAGNEVANNSLKGADVDEATLGQVPSALTATIGGRGGPIQHDCDPETTAFDTCGSVGLTVPSGPDVGALVFGHARALPEPGVVEGIGVCRLATSAAGPIASTTEPVLAHGIENVNLVGVVALLGPGPQSFAIECNQNDTDSEIEYDFASVQVVALAPGLALPAP